MLQLLSCPCSTRRSTKNCCCLFCSLCGRAWNCSLKTKGRDLLLLLLLSLLLLSSRRTLRPPLTRLNCFCFRCRCDDFDRRAFNCRLWRGSLNWCCSIFVFVGVVQEDATATIYSIHLLLLFLLLPTSSRTRLKLLTRSACCCCCCFVFVDPSTWSTFMLLLQLKASVSLILTVHYKKKHFST